MALESVPDLFCSKQELSKLSGYPVIFADLDLANPLPPQSLDER